MWTKTVTNLLHMFIEINFKQVSFRIDRGQ